MQATCYKCFNNFFTYIFFLVLNKYRIDFKQSKPKQLYLKQQLQYFNVAAVLKAQPHCFPTLCLKFKCLFQTCFCNESFSHLC